MDLWSTVLERRDQNDLIGWQAPPNTRGTWDILWTCAQTLALCAWVSVCTNVPDPRRGQADIVLDKLYFVLLTLLGPELVVLLAFGQYDSARSSVPLFHAEGYTDWTIAHGFYADMGAIHVKFPDCPSFPVDAMQLLYLIKHEYMQYPQIPRAQIRAAGKVDIAARCITVVQAVAFLITTVTRLAQGLATTTLELTVMASIFCTVVTFGLWWHKPADVDTPIIYFLARPLSELLSREGCQAGAQYCDTPLDFIGRKDWVASLCWNYYVNILRRLHLLDLVGRDHSRPRQRIPTLKWLKLNSTSDELICTGVGLIYCAIFLSAWNFEFPTEIERQIWRAITLVQVSISAAGAAFTIFQQIRSKHKASKLTRDTMAEQLPSTEKQPAALGLALQHSITKTRRWWNRPCNNDLTLSFQHHDIPLGQLLVLTPICGAYVICRWFLLAEDIVSLRAMPKSAYALVDWTVYWPRF